MMATYCFFLIIVCAGGAFSILSCAGEDFSLDCTLLQHEKQSRGFSTFLQPERQCCKCSVFLQPEKQCRGLKALHGYAITFNGSSALDLITVPAARESHTRSNANRTAAMDVNDDTFVQVSTHIPLDTKRTSMFVVELCVTFVTVIATVLIVIMLYLLTMRRKITKLRSSQQLHDDLCPQLHISGEYASEAHGSRSITPRPCSSTMPKDYDLSGRKGYVETPVDSDESSSANGRDKCKTTQKNSFQDPPLTPEKRSTNQIGNLDEELNSQILDDIRELKERIACKICLERDMCVVFLPCNHMVTCENCSMMLDRCAVCRTVIKGTFTVYTQF